MNLVLTVLVIASVLALIAVLVNRRSKVAEDGIAEFRRQLGALSPDAGRPVVKPHADDAVTDAESDHGS